MRFVREITGILCVTAVIYILWKYINVAHLSPQEVLSPPANGNAVKVAVYYESLCPDSVKFVVNQLWPTYEKVSSILSLDLVPFGKASFVRQNDHWLFTCQHGLPECKGNKIQACAISLYSRVEEHLPFINCVMNTDYPPDAGQDCASTLGLDWNQISQCADGKEGENVLHEMGVKTQALHPKLHFVPWITVNGFTSNQILDQALNNFLGLVCKTYSGPNPPAECSN